ncbi:MAG: HD domain-containing protein [Spirochaetales bacterium]|nr:HD domain-containing protein [Spirochaetales bacterium]
MIDISVVNMPDQAFSSECIYLDNDYILLSPETPMMPSLKHRLIEWNFKEVKSINAPVFTELASFEEAEGALLRKGSGESQEEIEANEFFKELCEFVEETFRNYKEKNELRLRAISEKVKLLIQMTKTHKIYLLNLAEYEAVDVDYSVSQSVKTAILTAAMSDTLRFPAHKQMDLATAALLHRIGVIQIPQELFYTNRALTPEEKKNVTLFPVLGFRILKSLEFPVSVALAVLEHRENIDGTGYPRGLTGDKTSLYGKLISVASAYCAAVSKRPFRDNMDGHSGMLELIKDKGKKYDEKILRVLLLTLTVYPIGTFVRLTDGSIGIVSQTNSAEPKFPVLKMIFDSNMNYYAESPLLQTNEGDDVQIDRALNRDEVEELKLSIPIR